MTNLTSEQLASRVSIPPLLLDEMPDPEKLLFSTTSAPAIDAKNIFPLEWNVETPKLYDIYDSARDPGWAPHTLPWDTLDVSSYTVDQRYAIAYWFTLLSVFDGSGPTVFARAMIHTYESKQEDPIRKCFFSVVRDEMNHEEVCGRAKVYDFDATQGERLHYAAPLIAKGTTPVSNMHEIFCSSYPNASRIWRACSANNGGGSRYSGPVSESFTADPVPT